MKRNIFSFNNRIFKQGFKNTFKEGKAEGQILKINMETQLKNDLQQLVLWCVLRNCGETAAADPPLLPKTTICRRNFICHFSLITHFESFETILFFLLQNNPLFLQLTLIFQIFYYAKYHCCNSLFGQVPAWVLKSDKFTPSPLM